MLVAYLDVLFGRKAFLIMLHITDWPRTVAITCLIAKTTVLVTAPEQIL